MQFLFISLPPSTGFVQIGARADQLFQTSPLLGDNAFPLAHSNFFVLFLL